MPLLDPKHFAIPSGPAFSPTPRHPPPHYSSLVQRILFYVCAIQTVVLIFGTLTWVQSTGGGVGDANNMMEIGRGRENIWCRSEFGKGVCDVYGAQNIKLSRLYQGTSTRLKHVFHRAQTQNSPLRIAAIGGSVTFGHGLKSKDEIWFKHVFQTLSSVHNPRNETSMVNGAVPAVGSGYFSACFSCHLPSEEVDIVFVELSINDAYREEDARSFEMLVRGLLQLPQQPAVVVVQTVGLSAELLAVGGDIHLPVASFYDIPVISLRPLVLPLMMEGANGLDYFVPDGWGHADYRHINARSHAALADLVSSFLLEQWDQSANFHASSFSSPQTLNLSTPSSTSNSLSFSQPSSPPSLFWPAAKRLMGVPKTLFFQKYDPSTSLEPLAPVCYTASRGLYASSIFPLLTFNQNWTSLTPASTPDKQYLFSSHPSAIFTLFVPVRHGKIQIYFLRAGGRSEDYGLGSVECWVGHNWEERRRFDGWWDDWRPHIGQFGIVATNLSPGTHQLSCRLMQETKDPGGGTNFRIISVAGI